MSASENKRVLISETGDKALEDFPEDTVFVLDDSPLKNPLESAQSDSNKTK